MPLGIILLIATTGLPIGAIYVYKTWLLRQRYVFKGADLLVPVLAASLQFLASTIPYSLFSQYILANFLHHAIGGGVVVSIISMYVLRRLAPKFSLWQQALAVLAAVNILGSANEILELAAEVIVGQFVVHSRLDTNIDIVANNVGAAFGFICIISASYILKRKLK